MRKAFHWIWGGLAGFCLMLVCLITAVDVVSYHMPGFYERTYESLRIPEEADISMENLLTVTQEMMEYLRGRRESLADIRTTIRGEEQFFFNAREVVPNASFTNTSHNAA